MASSLTVAGLTGVVSAAQVATAPVAAAAIGDNPQDEAAALAQAAATGKRVEVVSERTEVDTIWANPAGTLTDETAESPIRVKQSDGTWAPIDLSLDSSAGRLVPSTSTTDVSFSGTGDGHLVTLRTSGSTSFSLGYGDDVDTPVVKDDSASYPVTGSDPASVALAVTPRGFTARVVLPSAPATAPSYTFPLTLNGLSAGLKDDVLTLSDTGGTVVAQSAPLSMWDASVDAAGDRANQVPVDAKLVTAGSGAVSLVLTPSMDWLNDPTTEYPVVVDPDVAKVFGIGDTYTSSAAATTNYVSDYRLRVGSDDGTSMYRTYLAFRTADDNGRDVSSATLKMYQYYGATCTAKTTNVYPAVNSNETLSDPSDDTPVPNSQVTWQKQNSDTYGHLAVVNSDAQWASSGSFNNGSSAGGCADAWVNLDVTRMVNGWTSGEIPNGSFALKASSETDSLGDKRFCSGNPDPNPGSSPCTTLNLSPVVSLTYWPVLGTQTAYSMTSHPLNDRSTVMVNNDNGNAVVQANDVKLNGRGLDLAIDRYYNSQYSEASTSLGTGGWSLSVGPDVYLEAGTGNYRYDYHAPGGTRYGAFVRKSTTTSDADYPKFYAPKYGGIDAELSDDGTGSGVSTFTMTFHHSQLKYVFKKVDTASNNLYLASMKDRSGNHIDFTYVSGTHQLASITDSESRTINFTYTSGRITQISSQTNAYTNATVVTRTWQYGYTGTQLTSYTDPAGKTTTYSSGALTSITDPVNQSGTAPTTTLTYYSGGAVNTVTYARAAGDVSFSFNYAAPGAGACPGSPDRSTKVSDNTTGDAANGTGPTYCFRDRNDGNAKLDVLDALGHDKGSEYTADNQTKASTTAGNAGVTNSSTVLEYGENLTDQLASVTEPKDSSGDTAAGTTFSYTNTTSAGGNWLPTAQRDAAGNCSNFGYDSAGRTTDAYTGYSTSGSTAASCANGSSAKRFHKDYNSDGSINWSYDGNGSSTTGERTDYTYWSSADSGAGGLVANTIGQLKSVTKPGGSCVSGSRHLCTSYSYDGAARVSTVTDGRLKLTRYTYDPLDRVTMVQLNSTTTCTATDISAGNCLTYTYDGEGNLTARTDKAGTSTFAYDRMNRQLSQALASGGSTVSSVSWTRDGAGNLTQYNQAKNGSTADTVTYTYDTANRPDTVVDATGTTDIDTDADGRTSAITYPTGTGITSTYSYTKRGKPDTFEYKSGTSSLLKYVYSYKSGTLELDQQKKETVSGSSTSTQNITYTYNTTAQLTGAANDAGDDYTYAYDDAGNLSQATTNGSGTSTYYGYDRAGELCFSGTGTTAPTQLGTSCPTTPSGYTARTSDHAGNNLGTTANPNAYNANSQATTIGGTTQTYLDLGNDLRNGAGTNTFINGPLGVTARINSGGLTYYTRDPSGQILNEHGASGTRHYLGDYQSSVTAMVSTTGTLMATYAYEPYGKATVNAQSGGTTAADNPWRYTGGYYDTEGDGNYHLGARYYDTAGHFTQPDSLQGNIEDPGTLNSYGYTGGDPVNQTDPSGRFSECTWGILDAGIGGLISVGVTAAGIAVGPTPLGIGLGAVGIGIGIYGLERGVYEIRHSCSPNNPEWGPS